MKKEYEESYVNNVAIALQNKLHTTDKFRLCDMADAVDSISGGTPTVASSYQRINKESVNSIPQTIYTFTATEDCLLTLVGTCATNTSSNDGYIYYEKNGTMEGEKAYLSTSAENPFNLDLSLDNGDVITICVSWDGTHTNCWFHLRLGIVVITLS